MGEGEKKPYTSPLVRMARCHFMPNPLEYHPTLETMLSDSGILTTPEPLRLLQEASIKNNLKYDPKPSLSNYDYLCVRQHVFGLAGSQTIGLDPEEEVEIWKKGESSRKRQSGGGRHRSFTQNIKMAMARSIEKLTPPPIGHRWYLREGASPGKTYQTPGDQRPYFVADIDRVAGKMVDEFREINLYCYCREDGITINEGGKRMPRMVLPRLTTKEAIIRSQQAHNQIKHYHEEMIRKSITTKRLIARLQELSKQSAEEVMDEPETTKNNKKKRKRSAKNKRPRLSEMFENIDSPEDWSEEEVVNISHDFEDITSEENWSDLDENEILEATKALDAEGLSLEEMITRMNLVEQESTCSTPQMDTDLEMRQGSIPTIYLDHLYTPIPTSAMKKMTITDMPAHTKATGREDQDIPEICEFPSLPDPIYESDFTDVQEHITVKLTPLVILPMVTEAGNSRSMEELDSEYQKCLADMEKIERLHGSLVAEFTRMAENNSCTQT